MKHIRNVGMIAVVLVGLAACAGAPDTPPLTITVTVNQGPNPMFPSPVAGTAGPVSYPSPDSYPSPNAAATTTAPNAQPTQ